MNNAKTLDKIQKLADKGKSGKIIKFLNSSDTEVVGAALEALSTIRDEDSVNSIAAMIDNREPANRIAAAKNLGNLGSEYAKTYLLHRMAKETDDEVKAAIKEALSAISASNTDKKTNTKYDLIYK